MPVPRLLETLPATDCILHRTVLRAPVGSNTEIDDESWPGFFHRALRGEERLFRCHPNAMGRERAGGGSDTRMKNQAKKIVELCDPETWTARIVVKRTPVVERESLEGF